MNNIKTDNNNIIYNTVNKKPEKKPSSFNFFGLLPKNFTAKNDQKEITSIDQARNPMQVKSYLKSLQVSSSVFQKENAEIFTISRRYLTKNGYDQSKIFFQVDKDIDRLNMTFNGVQLDTKNGKDAAWVFSELKKSNLNDQQALEVLSLFQQEIVSDSMTTVFLKLNDHSKGLTVMQDQVPVGIHLKCDQKGEVTFKGSAKYLLKGSDLTEKEFFSDEPYASITSTVDVNWSTKEASHDSEIDYIAK